MSGTFIPVTPDPALPTILHAGDSLSIGMVANMRTSLSGEVNILRPPENCQHTWTWLEKLENDWLNPTRNYTYEMVIFNAGLWDINEDFMTDSAEYADNLEAIVAILKARCLNATLLFVNTTYVGASAVNRDNANVIAYNAAAAAVMAAEDVEVYNMYTPTNTNYATWYDADDVHLNTTGYTETAALLEARIRTEFGL